MVSVQYFVTEIQNGCQTEIPSRTDYKTELVLPTGVSTILEGFVKITETFYVILSINSQTEAH